MLPDRSKQLYLPDTNVLITRFLFAGVGEVQDFMLPPRTGEAAHRRMIRQVLAVRGKMSFVVDAAPVSTTPRWPRRAWR